MPPTTPASWTSTSNFEAGPDLATEAADDPASHLARPWRPRPTAQHLMRTRAGVYHMRLVIPAHVRALHPELPGELRRSTKTSNRCQALRIAREMCGELVTSLEQKGDAMLGLKEAAHGQPKQGFRIEWIEGALNTELYPGAQLETIRLYTRLIEQLAAPGASAHTNSRPEPAGSAENTPVASHGPDAAVQRHEVQPREAGSNAHPQTMSHASPAPSDRATLSPRPGTQGAAQDDLLSPVAAPVWLSEAVERWRTKAGVKFSNQSWNDAYKPTFRVFREMLGTVRRDVVDSDGSILRSKLDVQLANLTRGHMELFHDLLRRFPPRQGKRNDGLEAPAILKRAAAERAKPQSDVNTAKKMRQVWPFINYASKKGWIPLELAHEFSLQLQAAENRAGERENAGGQKKGAIALSIEELCGTYESHAYLAGAMSMDWKYWIDPMRVYTGARVSEISQLYTNDIVEVNGIPCISFVNDSIDEENEDEGGGAVSKAESIEEFRRLKNRASRRVIPIHPALIQMGFLDWVKKRQERVGREPGLLFYGLTWERKSGYGRKASRHTLNLLKAAGVWRKRTKVGHSLRSNCAQELLRVGMPFEMVQRYIGHTTGKQLETAYGGADAGPAYPLALALEYLKKTDFGVTFPSYAEIRQKQTEQAREKQLSRKNGVGARVARENGKTG